MKVALYCRLSEEDRNKQAETDDSESIQNQKSLLIQYAGERQWEIYNIYSDDDYTGADRNRPEFNRLISDAQNRKFDIVLCKTQSRFTRELEIVEKYIHGLFPLWGVRFVSVVDNADTEVKGNKKSRQINGLINEWYLEDMSDNIKSVLTNRRKNGLHIGSFALYGYMKDPKRKGHLLIDEEAAEVVREVFEMFAHGYGKTAIARILNDRNIPNPTEYKRIKNLRYKSPKSKNGTLWKYFAIADMLVNEIYIGNMVQGKYGSVSYKTKKNRPLPKEQWIVVKNTHEPIIGNDLWDRVQSLVRQKHKPFIVGQIGIFSKKTVCKSCGYTMRSCKNHGRHYLKCGTKHTAKNACVGAFISVESLEKAVSRELRKMNDIYLEKDRLEQQVCFLNTYEKQNEKALTEIKAYEKKISEFTKYIKDSYIDKAKGTITEKTFLELTNDFSQEKERLEKLVDAIKHRITDNELELRFSNKQKKIDQYIFIPKLDRLTIETMIDFISIGHKDPVTKHIPVEIHWSF